MGQGAALGEDGAAMQNLLLVVLAIIHVPVTIRYKDQDGKAQVITKTVEYTVARQMLQSH